MKVSHVSVCKRVCDVKCYCDTVRNFFIQGNAEDIEILSTDYKLTENFMIYAVIVKWIYICAEQVLIKYCNMTCIIYSINENDDG